MRPSASPRDRVHRAQRAQRALLLLMMVTLGCGVGAVGPVMSTAQTSSHDTAPQPAAVSPAEARVRHLSLDGEAASPRAQFSGMTWIDTPQGPALLLAPQYPDFAPERDGAPQPPRFFLLQRTAVEAALDSRRRVFLTPEPLPMHPGDYAAVVEAVRARGARYEGFEAVAAAGGRIYLVIEARSPDRRGMVGFLVLGWVEAGTLRLNPRLVPLAAPSALRNMGFEAAAVAGDRLYILYEANGRRVTPQPVAHVFSLDGEPLGEIPFPALEYRVTAASAEDIATTEPTLWVTNVFWPGQRRVLNPAADPLAARYGEGASHAATEAVERLVALTPPTRSGAGFTLASRPPVQLAMGFLPNNWEGLALLRRHGQHGAGEEGRGETLGALLLTDTHPVTRLAYVAIPIHP